MKETDEFAMFTPKTSHSMSPDPALVVTEIMALFERYGADAYIGEPVSQLEHMGQSAQLAEGEGYDEEVILAAFLHDIGHLCANNTVETMAGYGVMRHEKVGADYLRRQGFSEKIAQLVENHVQAKRYLTFSRPAYYEQLSEASRQSLEYQGGRMTAEEAGAFEQNPLFAVSIRMRYWDEMAKQENVPPVDLRLYRERMLRHLTRVSAWYY